MVITVSWLDVSGGCMQLSRRVMMWDTGVDLNFTQARWLWGEAEV
jgi:hypothetical protein